MIFIGETEKWFPGFGVFKPGDEVEYNEFLFFTGLFEKKQIGGVE